MRFRIVGEWPISKPTSRLVEHGTIVDASLPEWSWVQIPPPNAVALDQAAADAWEAEYVPQGLVGKVSKGRLFWGLHQPTWGRSQWPKEYGRG
jgi:hypothetical protein